MRTIGDNSHYSGLKSEQTTKYFAPCVFCALCRRNHRPVPSYHPWTNPGWARQAYAPYFAHKIFGQVLHTPFHLAIFPFTLLC